MRSPSHQAPTPSLWRRSGAAVKHAQARIGMIAASAGLLALCMLCLTAGPAFSAVDGASSPSLTMALTQPMASSVAPKTALAQVNWRKPKPQPTPRPTKPSPRPTTPPRQPVGPGATKPTSASTKGQSASPQSVNGNPWGYNFTAGAYIYNPSSAFCRYFTCIPSFWRYTNGYVVECQDGAFSHSGGRPGACSDHRGVWRTLYSH